MIFPSLFRKFLMISFLQQPGRLDAFKAGLRPPLVVQNAAPSARPYLHPMLAPDGLGCATENAPPHHPWQHGLYFGLNKVNGVGFWTERLRPKSAATDGTVNCTQLVTRLTGRSAQWTVTASWRGLNGEEILADSTDWTLTADVDRYWLDVSWRLTAAIDVQFGQYPYGGMFLRMPLHEEADPCLLSSEGATSHEAAEGQRAQWLAVAVALRERMALPADRQHVCIALLDHPSNPEHPTPWRADNKFGIGPSRCVAGPWQLTAGASAVFRHRILVTIGRPNSTLIEASYKAFTGKTPCQLQSL